MATDPTAETQELLRRAIRDQYGLDSKYVESVPLLETLEGTPREGTIHVFRVGGHPHAELAYAWSYKDDEGAVRQIAVLGVPPIDGAKRAFHAACLAELCGKDSLERDPDPRWRSIFDDELAVWTAKSYDDLRAALAVENAEVRYRRGPDDLYEVEVQILARGPDYLQVWVSVGPPRDAIFGGFIRHADGRLQTCPDLATVFRQEYAAWTAKSYAELQEALADVIAGTTCCINYVRGPDDLYQVEVQPLENRPDYLHVLVSVCAPYDAVDRSFIRHADGRLDA